MSQKRLPLLFSFPLLLLVGCYEKSTPEGDSVVCTTLALPAIEVTVFDQETGFGNACGATVTVEDGSFIEEVTYDAGNACDENFTFKAAYAREGTYDVAVSKEGFADWVQYDVEVTKGICHVNTISLQAYLEKQ